MPRRDSAARDVFRDNQLVFFAMRLSTPCLLALALFAPSLAREDDMNDLKDFKMDDIDNLEDLYKDMPGACPEPPIASRTLSCVQ